MAPGIRCSIASVVGNVSKLAAAPSSPDTETHSRALLPSAKVRYAAWTDPSAF
jgi:hypothetical protein